MSTTSPTITASTIASIRRRCARSAGCTFTRRPVFGATAYPFIMYLHGLNQDEQSFLDVAPLFDEGIRKGIMPPCVITGPRNGTINGDPAMFGSGNFYLNSDAGRFERLDHEGRLVLLHA